MDDPPIDSSSPQAVFSEEFVLFVHNLIPFVPSQSNHDLELISSYVNNESPDILFLITTNDDNYHLFNDLSSLDLELPRVITVMMLIKSRGKILGGVPFYNQINILNIPTSHIIESEEQEYSSNEIFERLRSVVNLGISPYFDLITNKQVDNSRADSSNSINITKKKFNELSLSLQHLQQRIQVPDLIEGTHPKVLELLQIEDEELKASTIDTLITDSTFLNELTNAVNKWIKQIQAITKLNHNPFDGNSIIEEIHFWKSMELTLIAIDQQINSPEIKTSIDILNQSKRFHITLSFQNDIGLSNKLNETKIYNSLLKDLPTDELLIKPASSNNSVDFNELKKFDSVIMTIFNHLKKLKNLTSFPLSRSIELIELIINDIINSINNILLNFSIMSLSLELFNELVETHLSKIFNNLNLNIKFMINLIRELLRKRQEKFIIVKINQDSVNDLEDRIKYLMKLRMSHENLLLSATNILQSSDLQSANKSDELTPTDKLIQAYNKYICYVNPLDVSKSGKIIWANNEKLYLNEFHHLESMIVSHLNNNFDKCVTFNDFISMFNTFNRANDANSDFSSNISTLLDDKFKLKLLSVVDGEITKLMNLNISNEMQILKIYSEVNSMEEVISKISWNIGLTNRLNFLKINLIKLLGSNWNQYSMGNKIDLEITSLIENLNPNKSFENWLNGVEGNLRFNFNSPVIKITENNDKANSLDLSINFDSSLLKIAQQTTQLSQLGFKIPVNLSINLKKAQDLHPLILTLTEHVNILKDILSIDLVESDFGKKFGFLLNYQVKIIMILLKNVLSVNWVYISQAYDLSQIDQNNSHESETSVLKQERIDNEETIEVKSLNTLSSFQDEIYKLYVQSNKISNIYSFLYSEKLKDLMQCDYDSDKIQVILTSVQTEVLKLFYENFHNFDKFIDLVNGALSEIFVKKCELQLELVSSQLSKPSTRNLSDSTTEDSVSSLIKISSFISRRVHHINFHNQLFIISPSLDETKSLWIKEINKVFSIIESQAMIRVNGSNETFKLQTNESIKSLISKTLTQINELIHEAGTYFNKWVTFLNLWELNINNADDLLGLFNVASEEDITVDSWLQIFNQFFELRAIADNDDDGVAINLYLSINYSKVQSRAILKLDNFQSQLLKKFSEFIQTAILTLDEELSKAKTSLESQFNLQVANIELIRNLKIHYDYKESIQQWTNQFNVLKRGQRLLTNQRFNFSSKWLHVEQLDNNLQTIGSLLERHDKLIHNDFDLLSMKITSESSKINESLKVLIKDWINKKPISGTLNPVVAISVLSSFRKRCNELNTHKLSVITVAKSLDLASISIDEDVEEITEEIEDLKFVWTSINGLFEHLERIKALSWIDLQPRDLRVQLDQLLSNSRSLPTKIRQYAAFDEIQNSIKQHLKNYSFINDLKSESLKPRHWKLLIEQLGLDDLTYDKLKVGHILGINFLLNSAIIKSVLHQANQEQTIEENLLKIENEWSSISLEMFNYDNKCRLVKNWNSLFDQCNNDLNALASMKNSAYYGNFEQQITSLEEKLNRLYILLDVWIDVQRQWVYLDGVFGSKTNDIKNLLPVETTRFTNISYDLMSTLKKIYKCNIVLDVLYISDIQEHMEKYLESLIRVRKSLTDYLERQRELFPRFYFVGNEDLLEIIGSATDVLRINKHLKKMFSGVSSVDFESESLSITAINSEQGEKVRLDSPVSLIKHSRLHEWLKELELEIKFSLSKLTKKCLSSLNETFRDNQINSHDFEELILTTPSQVMTLALQIYFTSSTELAISRNQLPASSDFHSNLLKVITNFIASDSFELLNRKKLESVIIEVLHQRDIFKSLIENQNNKDDLAAIWDVQQLFYFDPQCEDLLANLTIKQAKSEFKYGYEYLGVPDRLAYTPLIDKCFLAMTSALDEKLGGSPFGPAGTGKTESIKALGNNLGKMVLVFCCDDSFDFQSMGRIFLGLCKVGCWGCFDEFNRLDSNILSAVSSQIESIEVALSQRADTIEISGKQVTVNQETGIFVTMNPGYVGRYKLPENLKKLFRSYSMAKPDHGIIADVLLTSQGFTHSKELSEKIVPLFADLRSLASNQPHYDFGLRTVKSTLNKCGLIKRSILSEGGESKSSELEIVLQSIEETVAPKLVKEDEQVLNKLTSKYFPGVSPNSVDYDKLIDELHEVASNKGINISDAWVTKALHLAQLQKTHHGLMLVGAAGSGKTVTRKLVLQALSKVDNMDHMSFTLDCKVLSKDEIYGSLDLITRDWTDGLFTSLLRRIKNNLRGELHKRIWIIFDGDIDPEWAENLNSVLDDNKLLTLPNGERIELPSNVRLIFEVDSLKYTTLATISRCGMIWFDSSLVSMEALFASFIHEITTSPLQLDEELANEVSSQLLLSQQEKLAAEISKILSVDQLTAACEMAAKFDHIMTFTIQRAVHSFFVLLKFHCRQYINFHFSNNTPIDSLKKYLQKSIILSFIWSLTGDCSLQDREEFGKKVSQLEIFLGANELLDNQSAFIDNYVLLPECDWESWNSKVTTQDLEPQHVINPSTIVPTLDTVRHERLIYSVLNEHKTLLLCGPPGSGKTMTLLEALRKSPSLDVLPLNFSKDTSPQSLMSSLEHHCTYKKTNNGITLAPKVNGKWVVVFCDEINLPSVDKYGTQSVISLMRQMIENGGFWRVHDRQWIQLSNIQFVGACNSPNDPGRQPLSDRFLRHACLIMVDYPGTVSLNQIYKTFNLAILKCAPNLRTFAQAITDAMIHVYQQTKEKLTPALVEHYIYSPRELTRWTRGILEALREIDYTSLQLLVRLWYHEGLRLFYDRLVNDYERKWTKDVLRSTIEEFFPNSDVDTIVKEPIFYSNWLTSKYEPADENELKSFVSERLRVFSEEEIEVDIVLYEELLDNALRIDRVLRQPQGHMILLGSCTSGKSTLTKFVAWINGLKMIQLRVDSNFSLENFDSTLKQILLLCAKGEKVCFLIDESSILETSFIERMNTLLANAEIPGLFMGDEFTTLMTVCTEQSQSQGLLLDSNDELYDFFTQQVSANLHVVFTISDMKNLNKPQVITSPALFNRCVLSWMGDWSDLALVEVSTTLLSNIPLDMSNYIVPETYVSDINVKPNSFREVLVDVLIGIHRMVYNSDPEDLFNNYPYRFMHLIKAFIQVFSSNSFDLEERQRHITTGLDKLRETVIQVNELKRTLSKKKEYLATKDKEAKSMLNKMLTEQNEAERKQEFSIATQEELEKQEVEIKRRRTKVMKDLEMAEPAVIEAQRGVQNIKKQHLTEIRSMSNPPAAVKMAMESVCILIGYDVVSWRDVQLIVRRDDFIANIVSFDNQKQLTQDLRDYMNKVYLSRSDYNFETVNRASKACGPLLQWVQAQMAYSTILENVGPLREEVVALEARTNKTRAQLIAVDQMISELELAIDKYKDDYSDLIRETENIKQEMSEVEKKVDRSMKLIDNLTSERKRWKESINKFGMERDELIGNSLLAASFQVYLGKYDQTGRQNLMDLWKQKLITSGISFDNGLSISSFLSTSEEILHWQQCGLPNDELSIENFTLLKLSKIPLLIDPTGAILDVFVESLAPKKTVVTSFLDDSFFRQLENSLRFGGTILIQDAEFYNPIIDPILKNEIHRNGGRFVIRLGNQEIDFSDQFRLILHTKDPKMNLSPAVVSRISVVNFTVTSGSLENQILNTMLQFFKPEINEKRKHLVGLKGEYHVRLLSLEKRLLESLSDSGNILDNDSILKALEKLKSEANEIDQKISESDIVMSTVDDVRNKYEDVAKHSVLIFNIFKELTNLNTFYNFSLNTYFTIFMKTLEEKGKVLETGEFVKELYKESYNVVSPSLVHLDKVVFALALAVSFYGLEIGQQFSKVVELGLKSVVNKAYGDSIGNILEMCFAKFNKDDNLSEILVVKLILSSNEDNTLLQTLSSFVEALSASTTEQKDSCMDAFMSLSSLLFADSIANYNSKYELDFWVQTNLDPIMLLSPEGYDATFKVEQLALQLNVKLVSISMGSKEGIEIANKEIKLAAKKGHWVLIQNIHMSSNWLNQLDQELGNLGLVSGFRLFMTSDLKAQNIPIGLVTRSKILTFENQPGLKSEVGETFKSIPTEITSTGVSEYLHVCFLLMWYHSLIRERLRYSPISFTKLYDINDSDFSSGLYVIKKLFKPLLVKGRSNVSPELIPWHEIRYLIGEVTYGGKIDDKQDLQYFITLSERLFTANSFEADFSLLNNEFTAKIDSQAKLLFPEGITVDAYSSWIKQLPDKSPLSWVGLEQGVDVLLREREAQDVAEKVLQITF